MWQLFEPRLRCDYCLRMVRRSKLRVQMRRDSYGHLDVYATCCWSK